MESMWGGESPSLSVKYIFILCIIHTYIYIYIYVCVYTYIHIYIYIHMHIFVPGLPTVCHASLSLPLPSSVRVYVPETSV